MLKALFVGGMSSCLAVTVARAEEVDLASVCVTLATNASESCRLAATELEKHLALVAGARCPEKDGWRFAVGERPAGEPSANRFESRAKVAGRTLFFWGDEGTYGLESSMGPLFAVYEFLDRQLGVRWMYPGDEGIVAPPHRMVKLSEGMEWRFTPPMEVCIFRGGEQRNVKSMMRSAIRRAPGAPKELCMSEDDFLRRREENRLWFLRMRIASTNRLESGHAFTHWQKLYLDDHPEWFAFVTNPVLVRCGTGSRGVKDSQAKFIQFCHSSAGAAKAIVADWVAKGAPRRLNLCLNDGKYCFCHCEDCLKLDARLPGEQFTDHLTDRVVHFYNLVMSRAVTVRPDVDACAFLYSVYRKPPRRERLEYGANMTISYVSAFGDDVEANLDAWQAAGMRRFYLRPNYMCYDPVFPRGVERYLYDVFQTARRHGMIGVDYDGSPRHVTALEYYVLAVLVRYPDRDFDEIVAEFCTQYGKACRVAQGYFERVRERAKTFLSAAGDGRYAEMRQRLDDSELGRYAVVGVTEEDLTQDLDFLRASTGVTLAGLEKVRFEKLVLRAEHALLTYRFLKASRSDDAIALKATAKTLYDFRVKNVTSLGKEGFSWLSKRGNERTAWAKAGYLK